MVSDVVPIPGIPVLPECTCFFFKKKKKKDGMKCKMAGRRRIDG